MTISASNSIYNAGKDRAYDLKHRVDDLLNEKSKNKKRQRLGWLKHFRIKATKCSQCGRGMDTRIAKLQIENKRENAPICIPCILGKPRRPLEDKLKK